MEENNIEKRKNAEDTATFGQTEITSDMTSKEAYFKMLRAWVNQANMCQNAMACFPYYLMANYPQMFQANSQLSGLQQPLLGNVPNGSTVNVQQEVQPNQNIRRRGTDFFDSQNRDEERINQTGGYEFIIAPLWKRFVAEVIDVAVLFLIKLLVTFAVVDIFDISLGIDFDLNALKMSIEDDYSQILSFTSELLVLEIITKIVVCFYEALWTSHGIGILGGATPGKILMGIRILYVDAVLPLEAQQPGININNSVPLKALLYPATNPGFKRALCRAIAKNLMMALLFPMCFVMFFFRNNRTGYDIMTKTIVVEENQVPVFRRR